MRRLVVEVWDGDGYARRGCEWDTGTGMKCRLGTVRLEMAESSNGNGFGRVVIDDVHESVLKDISSQFAMPILGVVPDGFRTTLVALEAALSRIAGHLEAKQ